MTLLEKAKQAKKDIATFKLKADTIIHDSFQGTPYYPACHNNSNKTECDHCIDCWPIDCNQSQCDRIGRCLCQGTTCICLGRC